MPAFLLLLCLTPTEVPFAPPKWVPLFSGVELVDGPWFGYDIDQLAAVPDVVLLSACEVGRSQVRFGEDRPVGRRACSDACAASRTAC